MRTMMVVVACLCVSGWTRTARADGPAEVTTRSATKTGSVVQGVVTYRDNGEPVVGATIVVANTGLAALTDGDGKFRIEGVPLGNQQIDVIVVSDSVLSKLVTMKEGATVTLALTIPNREFAGEVIVVTGTRSPEKVFDAPISVEAVSGEQIARTAGPSYLSALADAKGVNFADAGILEQRISTRGFNTQFNSRMLSMVNGRLASLPGSGLAQGNLVPTNSLDIKSVEVVEGPASALYGANAHAGVVNVRTKSPWDESGVSASLRGGTQSMLDGTVRVAGTVADRFGWKVNGQHLQAVDFAPDRDSPTHYYNTNVFEGDLVDNYDVGTDKIDGATYYRAGDWTAKAAGGFSQTNSFSLTNAGRNHIRDWQVQYQNLQVSHPNWYAQVTRTATNAGGTYQLDRLAAAVDQLEANGQTVTPEVIDGLRDQLKFVDRSQLIDSEVQHRSTVLGTDVTVGAQYRLFMPNSAGTYLADAGGQNIDSSQLGGYAQLDRHFLDDRLRAVLAGRIDYQTNYSTQLSPKAGLVYALTPAQHIRVAFNHAYKSPTILENYLLINDILRGNRNGFTIRDADGNVVREIAGLDPETVNSVEIGYKGAIGSVAFIDAVAYHSWHRDFISPLGQVANPDDPNMPTFAFDANGDQVANGALFTYVNFGKAQVQGADLGVNLYPTEGVTVTGGASYIDLVDFAGDPMQNDLLLNVPPVKLKSSVTVQNLGTDGWFVRLAGRWTSSYRFESGYWSASRFFDDGKIPSRFVADLSAGYDLPHGLGLRAFVMNTLNDHGVDVLGAPVPRRMAFLQLVYRAPGLAY